MNIDKTIDGFLSKKKISANEDFTDSLFLKIEKDKEAGMIIDEFLQKEKIAASPDFSQKIMREIAFLKMRKVLRYASSFAAAACVAFAFFMARTDKTSQIASELQEIENAAASLSEYEKEFNSYAPNFCDYDLTLYAVK